MPNVSEAVPTTGRYRLLGHPTDLAGHVATLGPAPLPGPGSRGWREAFVSVLEASGLAGRGGAGSSGTRIPQWSGIVAATAPKSTPAIARKNRRQPWLNWLLHKATSK